MARSGGGASQLFTGGAVNSEFCGRQRMWSRPEYDSRNSRLE